MASDLVVARIIPELRAVDRNPAPVAQDFYVCFCCCCFMFFLSTWFIVCSCDSSYGYDFRGETKRPKSCMHMESQCFHSRWFHQLHVSKNKLSNDFISVLSSCQRLWRFTQSNLFSVKRCRPTRSIAVYRIFLLYN